MLCLGLRNKAFCMQFRVDKLVENFSFDVFGPIEYVGVSILSSFCLFLDFADYHVTSICKMVSPLLNHLL